MGGTAEVLRIGHLGKLLKNRRDTKGIGLRGAAAEAGVSFNTLARVEAGHVPDIETFSRLARWVGRSPAEFFGAGGTTPESTPGRDRNPSPQRLGAVRRGSQRESPGSCGRPTICSPNPRRSRSPVTSGRLPPSSPRHLRSSRRFYSRCTTRCSTRTRPVALRRGFKAEAERLATDIWGAMGLSPGECMDGVGLAKHIGCTVRPADELVDIAKLRQLKRVQDDAFFACTFKLPKGHAIVFNPLMTATRRNSDIAHEVSHIVLDHRLSRLERLGGVAFLAGDKQQEDEAAWLSGCLLLPRFALIHDLKRGHAVEDDRENAGVEPGHGRLSPTGHRGRKTTLCQTSRAFPLTNRSTFLAVGATRTSMCGAISSAVTVSAVRS